MFHSFSGDRILYLEKWETIELNNFNYFYSKPDDIDQTKEDYEASFKVLMDAINIGKFQKVILSRTKGISTEKTPAELFKALNDHYKNTFNYLVSSPETGTWMGATPERLLTTEGKQVKTMALAGTKTPENEWTDKEKEEQDFVTQTIIKELERGKCETIITSGPTTIDAGKIQHLKTEIEATLQNSEHWKLILNLLHPTPAVCGVPTSDAWQFIPEMESHKRKFYTGFIAVLTKEKKQFFVNLRCMELYDKLAKLYIGGGITAPSVCELEWQETERKAGTLTQVLI